MDLEKAYAEYCTKKQSDLVTYLEGKITSKGISLSEKYEVFRHSSVDELKKSYRNMFKKFEEVDNMTSFGETMSVLILDKFCETIEEIDPANKNSRIKMIEQSLKPKQEIPQKPSVTKGFKKETIITEEGKEELENKKYQPGTYKEGKLIDEKPKYQSGR
ncbi:MAG: hypothetical protein FWE47_02850 [Oscillospiraceae bacterium]|nr:hypothetical protein [Oscillospiraceae bacterium]